MIKNKKMDYQNLWDTAVIDPAAINNIKAVRAKILAHQNRYESVATSLKNNMPWWIIAVIHYREANLDFTGNLANGDPLTARTVNEPKGRPLVGNPPFTWEFAAVDALQERNLQNITSWDIVTILSELEKYNGTGYIKNHPSVLTPYLWSKTNHYTRGKYSSDGHFDPNLVDKQIGCMPLIRYITDKTLQS